MVYFDLARMVRIIINFQPILLGRLLEENPIEHPMLQEPVYSGNKLVDQSYGAH
jgi:hypothetical protein